MSSILDKQFILVTGKGGVGRSTVAAALGAALARRGRRTLLFEANANDRFAKFLGGPAVGPQVVELRPNLHAVNTTPYDALHEYGLMVLRFERVYKMVFENRFTRAFLRAVPGLDDYSLLGKAWYHSTETSRGRPRFDTVVFDMPASGHALSLLRIPSVILETVPDGPLTRDAGSIRALLTDRERTAVLLVTLAEEMPANEAREFSQALERRLGMAVSHLVINQVYPDRFPAHEPASRLLDRLLAEGSGDPDLAALAAHGELARRRRALNERYLRQLGETIQAPQTELPLLFVNALGPGEIDFLGQSLARAL